MNIKRLWAEDGQPFAELDDGTIVGGDAPPTGWTAPEPLPIISLDCGSSYLHPGDPGYDEALAGVRHNTSADELAGFRGRIAP